MGVFLVYNLKLSICFLLFFLLYKGLLCRNTFHRTNRAVLLSAYLFILFVPLIPLAATRPPEIHEVIGVYEFWLSSHLYPPPESTHNQPVFNWIHMIVAIYITGVIFFTLRYLYLSAQIVWRIRSGEKIRLSDTITLIISNKQAMPFSWMRYIVLSGTDAGKAHLPDILLHERAHIERRHSFDLQIANLFAIIQWYNPIIWLIKNELQDVHEYEADEAVIHSGVDPKAYQLLLIEKAVGSPCFNSMSNSLNHSKLKKRITMMLKNKNTPWARLKYLSILPLTALAVTLFARPELSDKLNEISAVRVSDFTPANEAPPESSADAPAPPAGQQTKQAKTKPAVEDSLRIVSRLKEWEEFFKTTSPEEFKEAMQQLKAQKERPHFIPQTDIAKEVMQKLKGRGQHFAVQIDSALVHFNTFLSNDSVRSIYMQKLILSADSFFVDPAGKLKIKNYFTCDSTKQKRIYTFSYSSDDPTSVFQQNITHE
jgi:beta-lactamase regulating signal transducer with metallopeptidase domain